MNIRRIIKEEILDESLKDRLKSAYQKWCQNIKLKDEYTSNLIRSVNGYIEDLGWYSVDFEDPHSETYKKAEELYDKGDYEGVHKLIAKYQCANITNGRTFEEWLSYRNQMKSSDIFQYKSEYELNKELEKAKEKSFTKKLKTTKEGKDYNKIYEDDDMVIIVPLTHPGSCKYGQGTRWCTTSKNNPHYFKLYNEKNILYRILQKNDNYKKLFNDIFRNIDDANKVSVKIERNKESYSMVDRADNYYNESKTRDFISKLPNKASKSILAYHKNNKN